jgi:2'-5' RNA ligase
MIRLFVAIPIPEDITESLEHLQAGLPGAHWTPAENMDLTLRFIGEVQEPAVAEIVENLWRIRAQAFPVALKGIGKFGGTSRRSPARLVYVGVEHGSALTQLASRVEQAVTDAGLPAETRKFRPHVTLGRLRGTPPHRLGDFIIEHNLYASGPFTVSRFALYSSRPGKDASVYEPLAEFSLAGGGRGVDSPAP